MSSVAPLRGGIAAVRQEDGREHSVSAALTRSADGRNRTASNTRPALPSLRCSAVQLRLVSHRRAHAPRRRVTLGVLGAYLPCAACRYLACAAGRSDARARVVCARWRGRADRPCGSAAGRAARGNAVFRHSCCSRCRSRMALARAAGLRRLALWGRCAAAELFRFHSICGGAVPLGAAGERRASVSVEPFLICLRRMPALPTA